MWRCCVCAKTAYGSSVARAAPALQKQQLLLQYRIASRSVETIGSNILLTLYNNHAISFGIRTRHSLVDASTVVNRVVQCRVYVQTAIDDEIIFLNLHMMSPTVLNTDTLVIVTVPVTCGQAVTQPLVQCESSRDPSSALTDAIITSSDEVSGQNVLQTALGYQAA